VEVRPEEKEERGWEFGLPVRLLSGIVEVWKMRWCGSRVVWNVVGRV
jgi:hypothetical protein